MIKIYLNSEFIMDSYDDESITGVLRHVANIDTDDLEEAFGRSQNHLPSGWLKSEKVENICGAEKIRSTSAGDVFELNGVSYKVCDIGFVKL